MNRDFFPVNDPYYEVKRLQNGSATRPTWQSGKILFARTNAAELECISNCSSSLAIRECSVKIGRYRIYTAHKPAATTFPLSS